MIRMPITVEDVTDADLAQFSDMYKECYNFRPRFRPTKADFVALFNAYDGIQADLEAQDRAFLDAKTAETGVAFDGMMAYYDWREAQDDLDFAARDAARKLELKERAELSRPGAKAVIDQWEHGQIG
jgi:hypothetical protein